jgi:hypothetical protein
MKVNQDEPNPKNGLKELMEMIQNEEVVPEDNHLPFYDENGRPLHFIKPKQEKEV